MGIFDKIKHAIFGDEANAAQAPAPTSPATPAPKIEPAQTPVSPSAAPAPAPTAQTTAAPAPSSPSMAPASPMQPSSVDVAAVLDAAARKSGQKLDWRRSVVDLMKAVGMDASLAERKELAAELHYTGDVNDSATMNIWLHKALLKKIGENGGKVPAELLD